MKLYFLSLATMLGTIIGVGLFGLPYVAGKSGFPVMIGYFVVITALIALLHLMYAEIALQSSQPHQFPGYVERFLGKAWKKYALLILVFAINGGLLAYLLIGGKFLFQLLSPWFGGSVLLYQILFYLAGAFLVYKGINSIAKTEFLMLALFLALIVIFFFLSIPLIHTRVLAPVAWKHVFFPYGIVIFSLWGLDIIPTLKEYLQAKPLMIRKVITHGVVLSAITYVLFIVSVFGVSGSETTEDAITGLIPFFNNKILIGAYVFGVLTTFTSFIALGVALKNSFQSDYQISHEMAWFLAMFMPITLLSIGLTNFLFVINITGALLLGCEGILTALMYLRLINKPSFRPKLGFSLSAPAVYAISIILTLGIVSEIVFSLISSGID